MRGAGNPRERASRVVDRLPRGSAGRGARRDQIIESPHHSNKGGAALGVHAGVAAQGQHGD
jgi:hypothetical protein